MKVRLLSILAVCFSLLSACSTTPESFLANKKKQLIANGYSMDFVDGYLDGCTSGKETMGNKGYIACKDQTRYMKEQEYSIGWEQGYYSCRDEDIVKLQHKVKQKYIPASDAAEEMEREKIWTELKK